MQATRRLLALCLAAAVLLPACGGPAQAAPMAQGGDTRDPGSLPRVVFEGPVVVRPGESGVVAFTLTNRYNQTMQAVAVNLTFKVGGDWLAANEVGAMADPPGFAPHSRIPQDLAPSGSLRVEARFSTKPATPGGAYLIALEVRFSYAGPNGTTQLGTLASLGSVEPQRRALVNMSDYNGTLDRLGLDGVVPDFSIEVDSGQAARLWWAAAGFGAAVVGLGAAYGALRGRRPTTPGRRR